MATKSVSVAESPNVVSGEITITRTLDAIHYLGSENLAEVMNWDDKLVNNSDFRVLDPNLVSNQAGDKVVARKGDWILRDKDGLLSTMTDEAFAKEYK